MKKIIGLIALIFLCNFAVMTAKVTKPTPTPPPALSQTREDLYIQIKDELQLTVDIQSTQVQVLMLMLNLNQKNLAKRNADYNAQIEKLKELKQYEGQSVDTQIAFLQAQLDSTRNDLSGSGANMDELQAGMKLSAQKIMDYYDKINALAQKMIAEVELNKNPKLPPTILKTMKASYAIMSKATVEKGMDQKAFDNFQAAADEYIKFLDANGGDSRAFALEKLEMEQYFKSAQANQLRYADLKTQVDNYQKMLDNELKYNKELQSKLDELRQCSSGIPYEDKIYFQSGSVILDKEAIDILKKFAASTPKGEDYNILITGYSDNTPIGPKLIKKYPSNWELSLARSSAVVHYLLIDLKFPPEKIIIAGKGEYPLDPKSAPLDKEQSRRVEFRFVPKQ